MSLEHFSAAFAIPIRIVPSYSEIYEIFFGMPSVLGKMIRPTLIYLFLIIALRLAGKRELAQLNPFDFVVLLTLSNTVQNAIIGNDNSVTGGIIGAATLMAINYFVVRFVFKHKRLDQIIEGRETTLIDKGKLQPDGLGRELISTNELLAVARRQGFHHLRDIERAVIETDGTFYLEGRTPPVDETRHQEILGRLDELNHQIQTLQQQKG
jgi:uncharacterized membrane protein YcaP (DUF421 family)